VRKVNLKKKRMNPKVGNGMEKPSEEEIKEILEKYPEYRECFDDLSSLLSFDIEKKKIRDNPSKIRSYLPEIRVAHKLWMAGLKDIEFIKEGNGKKPEFRVRVNDEWVYFEVKSFLFREDIWEEFEKLKNELERIESIYFIRISIRNIHEFKKKQLQEILDGIRKRFDKVLNGSFSVPYQSIGELFNCNLDILEKESCEEGKYTMVDLPFPHGTEDISLLTCEIYYRLKEAFIQLNSHAPQEHKIIVLYSYLFQLGVPLPNHLNPLKLSTNIFFHDRDNDSVPFIVFLSVIGNLNETYPNPNYSKNFDISAIENAFKQKEI
jgi:hypothetical protein